VEVRVRWANGKDLKALKRLADEHRHELGFVKLPALEQAVKENRLLVAVNSSSPVPRPSHHIIGFVHFRCCKDGHATIYEIAVAPEWRGKGVGRKLVAAVIEQAKSQGCRVLRLKCPIDLPANGFYARLGFSRIAVEDGKLRPLAVWELILEPENFEPSPSWQFFIGLTADASQIRSLVKRFFEGYGFKPPFNPFERIIVSPLFAERSALRLLKAWRLGDPSALKCQFEAPSPKLLMFDSGGFQVQMGKISYEELCKRLRQLYEREDWADLYVLPDHVPTSRDTDSEVERKVKETLIMGELFLEWLNGRGNCRPADSPTCRKQVVGVVHGRTVRQVVQVVGKWHELGVDYIAFGSFGTSGPKGSVNMLSGHSLKLLQAIAEEASANGQKLHIFGIGNPTYLLRLAQAGITPTSFDSTGWWKAGGFGKVFFSSSQQWHITRKPLSSLLWSDLDKHSCPFCLNLRALRRSRWLRVLHNLVAFVETVQKLNGDGVSGDGGQTGARGFAAFAPEVGQNHGKGAGI